MTSYDDLIKDASDIMYMNKYSSGAIKDVSKHEAFKLWNFNFKAAPKAGVSVAHNWTRQQEWTKDDKYAVKEKNATKLGWKHDDIKTDVAAANDKCSIKVAMPLVKEDWKVNGSVAYEGKPTVSDKINVDFGIESPDMSGANVVMDVGLEQEFKFEKKERVMQDPKVSVGFALNVEKDNFIGAKVEFKKELTDAEVLVMRTDEGNKYFFGANMNKQFNAGCMVKNAEHKFIHAYELHYDADEKAEKRLGEQPMHIAAGGKYQLSDKTTFNYMFEFNAAIHSQAKFAHKMDKNWSVAAHQSFDINACEKKHPYQLGFDVNYTL